MADAPAAEPNTREPVRFLVLSGSLGESSFNERLARLAAVVIEANGGTIDFAAMHDFDALSYDADVQAESGFPPGAEKLRECLHPRNPVRVGERSARFLPRVKPAHTFLEIDSFTRCWTPASLKLRRARTARVSDGAPCSPHSVWPGCGSASCSTCASRTSTSRARG